MISFEGFIYEVIDLTLIVEFFLAGGFVDDVVEVEVFGLVAVEYLDFLALGEGADAGVGVTIFYL